MGSALLWLITGIQGIFLPLLEWFGKRAVLFATVVTSFVALTAVLATAFQAALAKAASYFVSDTMGISAYVGLILPANFSLLASLCISFTIARMSWSYMLHIYELSKS